MNYVVFVIVGEVGVIFALTWYDLLRVEFEKLWRGDRCFGTNADSSKMHRRPPRNMFSSIAFPFDSNALLISKAFVFY